GFRSLVGLGSVTGIGGGNFGDAYLQVRRPEAEEETKTPHNYIIHSLCQFGVFAGGAYVILVGLTVVGAWRSVVKAGGRLEFYLSPSKLGELMFILMLSAVLSRWYFAGMHGILLLVDAIFPAILFGVMIWAFAVQFRSLPMWACSLALAAGVSAFVLHNMVTYSLWSPGTAALFWLTAGAACAAGGRAVEFRKKTVAAAICIWAVMCVFVVAWIVRPVTMRMFFMQKLGEKLCNRDVDWRTAEKAAAADPLDYIAARNVASQIMMELFRNGKTDAGYYRYQQDVLPWLKESQRRNPQNSQSAYYVALLESHFATSGGFDEFSLSIDRAEKLNPSDADFILRLAVLCNIAGRHEKQRELIAHAKELNDRLKKFSPYSTAILPQERFEEASRESDSEKAKQALFPFVIE
ncbi:MAG TPA: hypothetical protein PKK48_09855, partial [Phycisphaerae bacterium]|nr:hypothetical protein [Phycisphaerae bacterium]